MIRRIIGFSLLGCCFIAITLYMFGVRKVSLSGGFLSFLQGTSMELDGYDIGIPDIPKIPLIAGGWNILNIPISVINGISSVINFLITFINTIVQFFVFIGLLLKNLIVLAKEGWDLPRVFPYLNVLSSYLS